MINTFKYLYIIIPHIIYKKSEHYKNINRTLVMLLSHSSYVKLTWLSPHNSHNHMIVIK
jgi:hypothetical protein